MKQAPWTTLIACVTTLFFFFSSWFSTPQPSLLSPFDRFFLIDDPKVYTLLDQLFSQYPLQAIEHPTQPSIQQLLQKINATPMWEGIYPLLAKQSWQPAPLFEKVLQGQSWRLFTPMLLHFNLLHLAFNLMWWILLGPLIERAFHPFQFILFILTAALFSNVAQYLVSGPNFLGLSGVVCALIGATIALKTTAPFLVRRIPVATLRFALFFIFGAAALQILFFLSTLFFQTQWNVGIANTAHITGLLVGLIWGKSLSRSPIAS